MPLPKPRQDENQQSFISRCLSSDVMKDEYPDEDQRTAVCYTQWRENQNNNSNKQIGLNTHDINASTDYEIRTRTFRGNEHIIVPVVLMVEGVHNGSQGPTLYTREELQKFPQAWNGEPLPVFHPEDEYGPVSANDPDIIEQRTVGHLFNVNYTEEDGLGKLKGELWIDRERCSELSPSTLAAINQRRRLDVSTGLFSEDQLVTGNWNNETYYGIARNIRPDHLALLPGAVGACSWEDGCGVRLNDENSKTNGGKNNGMKRTKDNKKNKESVDVNYSAEEDNTQQDQQDNETVDNTSVDEEGSKDRFKYFQSNSAGGYRELTGQAQRVLDSMDTATRIHYLVDMFDDYLVYRVEIEGEGTKLFRSSYSVNDNQQVALEGEPVEVIEKTEYVEVSNNSTKSNSEGGGKQMDKREQKIKGIIANEQLPFTEDNRQCLENFTEEQLNVIEQQSKQAPTDNSESKEVTKDQAVEVLREQLQNREQFLQLLPEKERQVFEHSLKLHEEQEQNAIKAITENSDFSEEDLKGKDLGELQKMAKAVKPSGNYAPMGGGETTANAESAGKVNEPAPLLPAGIVANNDKDENKE